MMARRMGCAGVRITLRSSATPRDLLDRCTIRFSLLRWKGHSQEGIPMGWEHLSHTSSRFWKREQTPRVAASHCAAEGLMMTASRGEGLEENCCRLFFCSFCERPLASLRDGFLRKGDL